MIPRLRSASHVLLGINSLLVGLLVLTNISANKSQPDRTTRPGRTAHSRDLVRYATPDLLPRPALNSGGLNVECAGDDDTELIRRSIATAKGGPIVIATGRTCTVVDITIPHLKIEDGGILKPRTGHTVTLSASFEAGPYQVFANAFRGEGTVSFANNSVREVYPQWWGARGDGLWDDTSALNAAFAESGESVFLERGSYKITANLVPPLCASISGAGRDQAILSPTAGVTNVMKVYGPTVVLENFQVDGSNTTNATAITFGDATALTAWGGKAILIRTKNFRGPRGVGIRIADALKAEFTGVLSDGNGIALLSQRITDLFPTTITFRNSQFINSQTKGVKLVDGHSLTFDGCVFESNAEEGAVLLPSSGGVIEGINFVNGCWFEDNYRSNPANHQFAAGDGTSIGGAYIRTTLRDAFFAGGTKSIMLTGKAVDGFLLDNVQVPNLANEIRIENAGRGFVRLPANLNQSVLSSTAYLQDQQRDQISNPPADAQRGPGVLSEIKGNLMQTLLGAALSMSQ